MTVTDTPVLDQSQLAPSQLPDVADMELHRALQESMDLRDQGHCDD
ncbi:MAG: hypothetical protein LCH98_08805 [Actinobacteria bacterium]|nr:hypothetical protein [Actinomycetota bacterium]